MKKTALFLTVLFTLGLIVSIQAHTPKNGLGAVAVSPDGKTIVVGGDTRTLYVLDPASLEVKKRIWLKTNIYEMAFNKDGSVLVVEDTSETLYFVKAADWQIQTEVKKAGKMSTAPETNLLAGLYSGYKKSTVKFLSMTDGTQKGQVEFPGKVVAIGLDAKGSRLVLLANGPKDQEQKKKTPKELKGLEKDTFKQKNDGKISILAEFAVPSGKKISQKTIFFSSGTPTILVGNKTIDLISYSNVNARIVGNKITLYKGKSSYNYGIGVSPDRKAFLVGGLRNGTRVNTENLIMTEFNINRLPGWPEYYKGFGFAKDGTGYATTTAYRLIKISKTGNIEKQVPIY